MDSLQQNIKREFDSSFFLHLMHRLLGLLSILCIIGFKREEKGISLSLLVLTLTTRELRHWPSIASMSPQSHCGDEEDGCIILSSQRHCICIMLFALCMLSTLFVMNQFLF